MRGLLRTLVAAVVVWGVAGDAARGAADAGLRRPNIVIVLADDLGFSDLGCYGSEIHTPNIDRLAKGGLRFTQFYNTARCCPSRASLMSGLYAHQVGMGHMTEDWRRPGYRGELRHECATLAELLRSAGYQTMMCGKWHLTRHTGPEGPKLNWPLSRGFDKFLGTIEGGGSYFDPVSLTRDEQFFRATGDFYYTDAISQQAAAYVEQAARAKKPFFLYVAYTAPHWPLHARPEDILRYQGKYAMGWDALREQRYKRMLLLDILRPQWPLTPRDGRVDAWEDVPYKQWHQRRMEVYAAQVDAMDRGVGRILDKIDQIGARESTFVFFLSDNGGCAEEIASTWRSPIIPTQSRQGQSVQVGNDPRFLPGDETTYQSYGTPWANASNTPFRLYKHWVHEGGIAAPLVLSWPAGIKQPGRLVHDPTHIIDIMPTCLNLAGLAYPAQFRGYKTTPLEGESLLPIVSGETLRRGPIFWEHEGNRAVRYGKWKLVSRYPGNWELYDMQADRTEMNNLAARSSQIVESMSRLYDQWAERANVEPWSQIAPAKRPKKR